MPDFKSVAEDLEWLREIWWEADDAPSEADIRRGSTTLHLLLNDGLLSKAWRESGFPTGEPEIQGPDIRALAAHLNCRLDMVASLVAGGGRLNGLNAAFIGAFRVDNPETGIPAEANEGFAVAVTSIVRNAATPEPSELDPFIDRSWTVSQYLDATAVIRKGKPFTRREVISYFRNYAGGAHSDLIKNSRHSKTDKYELIHEIVGHVRADIRDGLYFELLSIGQAVARSPDTTSLLEKLRQG